MGTCWTREKWKQKPFIIWCVGSFVNKIADLTCKWWNNAARIYVNIERGKSAAQTFYLIVDHRTLFFCSFFSSFFDNEEVGSTHCYSKHWHWWRLLDVENVRRSLFDQKIDASGLKVILQTIKFTSSIIVSSYGLCVESYGKCRILTLVRILWKINFEYISSLLLDHVKRKKTFCAFKVYMQHTLLLFNVNKCWISRHRALLGTKYTVDKRQCTLGLKCAAYTA